MKVYVVTRIEYDYSPIEGVFSTEELAKEFVERKQDANRYSTYDYEEFDLDG